MQEKESIMVVRCELKIPSLWITVRHHSASLVMQNSYPCDGIFNQHLTIIKDSYNKYYIRPFLYNIIKVSLRFSQRSFTKRIGYNTNCIGANTKSNQMGINTVRIVTNTLHKVT